MNKVVLHFFTFLLASLMAMSMQGQSAMDSDESMLPKVFIIGDFQEEYESLFKDFPDILINVCLNEIDTAETAWHTYMKAMEDYSKEIGFDLGGTVFWINVFWSKEGEVKHIAYHLQPHSRFVKDDLMLAFLRSFASKNKIGVTSNRPFNHYGTSSFPLYFKRPAGAAPSTASEN